MLPRLVLNIVPIYYSFCWLHTSAIIAYIKGCGLLGLAHFPLLTKVAIIESYDQDNPFPLSVTVWLSNPQDVAMERLGISTTNTMGIDLQMSDHSIQFTGVFPSSVYTSVVRSVTYQHLDANPGNPTTSQVRLVTAGS